MTEDRNPYNSDQQPHTPAQMPPGGNIALSVVGAFGGAAVGAIIWFAIAHYANLEIGYIAILIGALAGWGAIALGKLRNNLVGIIAAVAGLSGIVGGSYASYYIQLHGEEFRASLREYFDEALAEDPEGATLTLQEQEAAFEKYYNKVVNSYEYSYFKITTEDAKELLFLILFGGFGLYYGYRVGSGQVKKGSVW